MRYVFGPCIANNVNLNGNAMCAGQVSPSAAMGFVGALLRKLGYETWDYNVLLVIHSSSLSMGRQRAGLSADAKGNKSIELSETLSGDVSFSIVFETDFNIDEAMLPSAIARMRFAGGVISTADGSPLHSKFRRAAGGPISNIIPALDRGFAMVPAVSSPGADIVSFGDEVSIRKIDKFLRHRGEGSKGYLVTVPVGYRLLEDPGSAKVRKGTRNQDVPHVFSEPSVGIAEFISVRSPRFRSADEVELNKLQWKWSTEGRFSMFSQFHLSAAQ